MPGAPSRRLSFHRMRQRANAPADFDNRFPEHLGSLQLSRDGSQADAANQQVSHRHHREAGGRAPELGQADRHRRPGEEVADEQKNASGERNPKRAGIDADIGLELDPGELEVVGDRALRDCQWSP